MFDSRRCAPFVLLFGFGLVAAPLCRAQNYVPTEPDNTLTPADPIGIPPWPSAAGTYQAVSDINGGLSFFLPVLSLPQRGGWNLTLGYHNTSPSWSVRQDVNVLVNENGSVCGGVKYTNLTYRDNIQTFPSTAPFMINLPTLQASIEYTGDVQIKAGTTCTEIPVLCLTNWVFTDWSGNRHTFSNVTACSVNNDGQQADSLAQVTDSSDGSWLRLDTSNYSSTITVRTKDGTTYTFPGFVSPWPTPCGPSIQCSPTASTTGNSNPWYYSALSSMADTNGNTVRLQPNSGAGEIQCNVSGCTLTDTIGRTITIGTAVGPITYKDSNGSTQTVQVARTGQTAQTYNLGTFTCNVEGNIPPNVSPSVSNGPSSFTLNPYNYTVTLPSVSGTSRIYTLQFDGFSNLLQINYAAGGYTKYDYQSASYFQTQNLIQCQQPQLQVAHKRECPLYSGACSSSQELVTTYTGSGDLNAPFNDSMVIQDPQGNVTSVSIQNSDVHNSFVAPHETDRRIFPPGQYPNGTPLRTIQTSYTTYEPGIDVQVPSSITTTLNDISPSISSLTNYQYQTVQVTVHCINPGNCVLSGTQVAINNPTETDEYDYGNTTTPSRKTAQTWMNSTNGSLYDIAGSHLLDRLATRTITDPVSNAQSTLSYGYNSVGDINSKMVGGTGVTTLSTSYQRDAYGNITQMTDPKSNVTNFGYSDNWANTVCAPSSNSSAYLTSITDALNHVTSFSHNSCTGSKASSTDPNGARTSLSYDAIGRLAQTNFPGGGQVANTYMDSAPNSVTTSTLVTSGLSRVSKTIADGLGRASQTQLTSDPDGVTYTDTTYDALGRVYCVSNPYRSTSDATYGITTHVYDALDRVTAVQPPDYWANSSASSPTCQSVTPSTTPANPSNYVATSYSGNATTVTDQAGKSRKSVTDVLGRLTQVFEDPTGLNYETDYGYDAFANLRTVNQKGGSTSSATWRTRTFVYDALSQLTSATNPESGTISYSYDNDGNLISKTSTAPNQDGFPGAGSATVSGSEQSQPGAPATAGTGSVAFSGTLQSKQVQTQAATAGTGSATVAGSEQSATTGPTYATGRITLGSTSTSQQSVTVGSYVCRFTFAINVPGSNTAPAVQNCLNNSGLVSATVSSNTLNLASTTAGTAGNYSLSSSGFNATTSGMSGGTDATTTYDTGSVWVTINGTPYSAGYGQSSSPCSLAGALASAISAGSFANASVNGSCTPSSTTVSISISAKGTGSGTNYTLSGGSSTNNSGLFPNGSFTMSVSGSSLTGGQDAVYNTIYDSGTSTITVNGWPDAVSWSGPNTSFSTIASALISKINGDSGAFVTASQGPITSTSSQVNLTARQTGLATNSYTLSSSNTYDSTDFSSPSFSSSNSGSTLTGGQDAGPTIYDSGSVWVTVNGTQYPASYGQSSSPCSLAGALASAVSAGSLASASVSGSCTPSSNTVGISVTAKSNGSATNYSLSSGSSTSQSGTFSSASFSVSVSGPSLTGGADPGNTTVTATFSYDALNRLTQKSFSDGSTPTVKYGYDAVALSGCAVAPPTLTDANPIGNRTAMCDGAGAESWSHDSMGRVLTDLRTTNGFTKPAGYTYNLDGSVATLTYPSSRVITYTPKSSGSNTASRPLSAVDSTGPINYTTAASYAPTSGLSSLTNGASLISSLYYNSRLQPCRISVKSSGKTASNCADSKNIGNVLDLTFGFNLGSGDNGNVAFITNKKDNTRSQNFSYDSLNRLATAQTQTSGVTIPNSNCWGLTFGYDPWGNLLSSTISGPSGCGEPLPFSLYATNNNQLTTSPTQLTGYCYDAAGNLVLNSTCPVGSFTPTYSYNAENQMTSTGGIGYQYDGDGRRVLKSSGTLYWYGMSPDALDETDLAGNTNNSSFFEYVFFNGRRIARRDYQNNVNYYFSDHLGTSRVVTNASGAILDDSDFYPFGGERVVLSSSGSHYKFTGKERDAESGLDEFRARHYSSTMSRFLSPDLVLGDADQADPQRFNLYTYSRNNPLTFVDDSGEDIKYAQGLKNADDVKDVVNAILANPATSSTLSGYVGPNNPDLIITSGDLSSGDTVTHNPDGTTTTTQTLGTTQPDIQTMTATDNGVTSQQTQLNSTTITIDDRVTVTGLPGVMTHESEHAGEARQDPAKFSKDAKAERSLPYKDRPQEQRAKAFEQAHTKEIANAAKEARQKRKQDEKKRKEDAKKKKKPSDP